MQSTTHMSTRELGAVLKEEFGTNRCREAGLFTNGGADAIQLQPGVIFTGGATPQVFDTGAPAAFTGICISTVLVQPGATVDVAWIARGPVTANDSEIDYPADGPQTATLQTAMDAAGFVRRTGIDGVY